MFNITESEYNTILKVRSGHARVYPWTSINKEEMKKNLMKAGISEKTVDSMLSSSSPAFG